MPSDAHLTQRTFGDTYLTRSVAGGGEEMMLSAGKQLALIVRLACAVERRSSREELASTFWADAPPELGRHAMRQMLLALRQRLGREVIRGTRHHLVLPPAVRVDRDDFLRSVESGDLTAAVATYTSDCAQVEPTVERYRCGCSAVTRPSC